MYIWTKNTRKCSYIGVCCISPWQWYIPTPDAETFQTVGARSYQPWLRRTELMIEKKELGNHCVPNLYISCPINDPWTIKQIMYIYIYLYIQNINTNKLMRKNSKLVSFLGCHWWETNCVIVYIDFYYPQIECVALNVYININI